MAVSPQIRGSAFWPLTEISTKGQEIHALGLSPVSMEQLFRVLQNSNLMPCPIEIRFDSAILLAGEFAHTRARGLCQEDGYTIFIHPVFAEQTEYVPYLVLQQLAFVLFGPATTPEEAEQFGAVALGIPREQYYAVLCELSTQTGGDELC